jgi:hypothetical protein
VCETKLSGAFTQQSASAALQAALKPLQRQVSLAALAMTSLHAKVLLLPPVRA